MREILFRGKTCNGKWAQGLLAIKDNKYYISNKAGMPFAYEVRPETVDQYTGLKDKNGTKIFEGDFVKKYFYEDVFGSSEEYKGVIKYIYGGWAVASKKKKYEWKIPFAEIMAYSDDMKHIEVIGNIHDNPELLGGGKE